MTAPVQPFNFGLGPITKHAWNKDRSQIAVSPNNSEVHIFAWERGQWERKHILQEHDLPITGIDWAPNTNRIVTCAQDKSAFVWTFDGKTWKPEMVLIRCSKAATCVKWSPHENKFAVGSGDKLVAVCYYEKENDWWVSNNIKKPIRSTVTSIDWHPNNVLLAVGSCDYKTRIFSAYIKEVDGDKASPSPWTAKPGPLGQLVTEYSCGGGGWVHSVKFSPSGNRLAWVGHDSSLSVLDATDQSNGVAHDEQIPSPHHPQGKSSKAPKIGSITTVKDWYLPFTCVIWVTENSLVAAGHDCCPLLFHYGGSNNLKFVSKLDVPSEQKSNNFSAMARFRNLDKSSTAESDATLKTLHQNAIMYIAVHSGTPERVTKFTTSGIDGLLVLWDLQKLAATVSSITVSWLQLAGGSPRHQLHQRSKNDAAPSSPSRRQIRHQHQHFSCDHAEKGFATDSKNMNSSTCKRKEFRNCNGENDFFLEYVEVWTAETPTLEKVEPTHWPPLVQPAEVKCFKPHVFVQA